MPSPGGAIEIFVFQGTRFLGSRCFDQKTIIIGSGNSAHLKLADAALAAEHAHVVNNHGKLYVYDKSNASEGILVNGKRVDQKGLTAFDEVRIGSYRLKFSVISQEAAARSPSGTGAPAVGPSTPTPAASAPSTHVTRVPAPAPVAAAKPAPTNGAKQATREPTLTYHGSPGANLPPRTKAISDPALRRATPAVEEVPYPPVITDEHDDEDDDESFVQPFSLLENIVRERFKSSIPVEPYSSVEVIRYRESRLIDVITAGPGESLSIGSHNFRLLTLSRTGTATFFFREGMSGSVVVNGTSTPLNSLCQPERQVRGKDRLYAIPLKASDYAQLITEDGAYLVRFVNMPSVKRPRINWKVNPAQAQLFAGSAAFHLLVFLILGFMTPEPDLTTAADVDRFAQISMQDIPLEKPEEPPPPPPEPEPEPEPEPPPPTPVVEAPPVPKPKPRIQPKRPRERVREVAQPAPPAPPQPSAEVKQAQQVLSVLQNISPTAASAPGRSNLASLVSNISAVRAPAGTTSSFKIAGVIGKLPGGQVRLATGGSGGAETKVGSQLLQSSGTGALTASASTGTRVQGRVAKAPTRSIGATGGVLSREEIQAVVSSHMARIQQCYESQLTSNPSLEGNIIFDWVIDPNGAVSTARQVTSTVRSAEVATCILNEIRSWTFPKPQGGAVQVRYPFVFRSRSF